MTSGGGYLLGFDVGGTRLKTGAVRLDGTLHGETVDDTSGLDWSDVWPLLVRRAGEHREREGAGLRAAGVAATGIVDSLVGVRHLPGKVRGLEGFPLRERLEAELGVPVRCLNDGAAATLAEWRFGAARGFDDVVGITLGTGVGSGVVVGGRPFETSNLGNGISVGHFTITTGGKLCLCGNRGCAETLVSADAVAGRLREAVTRRVPSVVTERFGRDPAAVTFASLVDGVRVRDRLCLDVFAEFVRDLGATIVTAVHAYNPSVVVLSGGPMAAADLFLPDVQAYVDEHAFVFPKGRRIELRRAQEETQAGVLGAAALVLSEIAPERDVSSR